MKTEKLCLPTVSKGRVRLACKLSAFNGARLIQVTPDLVNCAGCRKVIAKLAASMDGLGTALRAASVDAARNEKVTIVRIAL